jgi:membrane associated rhomboid family serine protease
MSDDTAGDALRALHAPGVSKALVTYSFLTLCVLVTVPSLFLPELYNVFGGIHPRQHWWQPFTASFEHGWPGFHGSVHLALNAFLILECGRPCERLLGRGRFLLLGLLALAANAGAVTLTEGVNGSSLVIWAWGPPLFLALAETKRREPGVTSSHSYRRLRGILVLMYGVIVLAMGIVPYAAGWRGNPLNALFVGNLFHLVATAVGIAFTLATASYIRDEIAGRGPAS